VTAQASCRHVACNVGGMADVGVDVAREPASRSPAKTKNGLALGLVLILLAVGGLAWWGAQRSPSGNQDAAESALPLETFVVNLAGTSQRAYLRVGITLGLAHSLPNRNPAEAVPMALVRDTILSVLATAKPEELLQLEGKQRLKDDLLKALRERVPQISVQNVYFTDFLVQM
jgi:flagellar protein FliL